MIEPNINMAFRKTVEKYPHKTAIVFNEKELSFSQLDKMVEKVAAFLYQAGVKKGERAIIYLPHMPQWIAAWLGLQRIGAIAIPVTHFYGHGELAYIAGDSGAETVFCAAANYEQVVKATPGSSFKRIIIADSDNGKQPLDSGAPAAQPEVFSFAAVLDRDYPSLPPLEVESTDIAEILYTGGTTGFPKGVPLPHVLSLTAMYTKRTEFETLIPKGEGVTVQGAPLNHILGQELGLGSLMAGDTLVLLPKMDIEMLLSHMAKYRANIFFCTPTLCRMILDHPKLDEYDLSSLLYVFTAGEALPAETASRWAKKFGRQLSHGYGSTESCGIITGIPVGAPYPEGTAGKVVPNKRVKLINADTLEPALPGEPGELYVASDPMVTAYLNKPEETARHFVEIDGQTWYKTGDIVKIDPDGWVFFVDRSVDLIKHKGYRVAATRVETAIYKHQGVGECCVVGVPDEGVGERIKAFIVPKANAGDVNADEIINWCKGHLSSYEVPYYVQFTDALPKSPVGKILRKKLRDEERQRVAQHH